MSNIAAALERKFKDNRIIFWYDAKAELTKEYEDLSLPGVEKIHVQGNEFEVKYITNKQRPQEKFLLYFNTPKPPNEENWLLDMELAHFIFETDQSSMFLQELGLGLHLKELVAEHIDFFRSKDRRQKLQDLLGEGDEHMEIRYKMLGVVFRTDDLNLDTFVHAHATAFVEERTSIEEELERYNLKGFYWGELAKKYQYKNDEPAIYDLMLEVFKNEFVLIKHKSLSKGSRLLLPNWRDSVKYSGSYRAIAARIAKDLNVEARLQNASAEDVLDDQLFDLTDKKIIHELVDRILGEEISTERVYQIIKRRENKFWYAEVADLFKALGHASRMFELVKKHASAKPDSFAKGVEVYTASTYAVDQAYRKFILHYRSAGHNRILSRLAEKVEKVYSNNWLLVQNNDWQRCVDALVEWPVSETNSQRQFFNVHVAPFIEKGVKVFVIISDALRYECGQELVTMLQSEDRYEATLKSMVGSLPSYTQLGMASLLPHNELAIKPGSDSVLADGISTSGIEGRNKVLRTNTEARISAIQAEDFMKLNTITTGREFAKANDVIYIYHNRIDKTGDDKTSEHRVFEAVEEELVFLKDVLKKVANLNGNHMLITSDHGFLYQHNELAESDFAEAEHNGNAWRSNRRFVIGQDLSASSATKAFRGTQLGLNGDVDVLIPKSINRLRVMGAGSRFVHGGASLQEIVVPVLHVTKKRQATTTQVSVDIIKSTDKITTNILAVSFIQSEPVTDKVLPRKIRAAIIGGEDELLSDRFEYNFDIKEEDTRQREVKHRFQLSSKATGKYKNQRVRLVLEEPVAGTHQWKQYAEHYYTLNISFTSDFDD